MPASRDQLDQRLDAIREILSTEAIRDQHELVDRLKRRRLSATQSVVSRDLRRLGAAKVGGRYRLGVAAPRPSDAHPGGDGSLLEQVAPQILRLTPAGDHLVIAHTEIGAASRVGLALDHAGRDDIAGTIAGDDTIFIATPSADASRRLITFLTHVSGARTP